MKRTIKTLLVALTATALLFAAGCEKEQQKDDEAQTETNATKTTEIPDEYKAEAAEEITEDNAEAEAAALEKEIEADLAD